jgi:hypothetical protein
MRIVMGILAIGLMTWPAAAQVSGMGGMGSRGFGRGHHDHAQTSDAPKKRVDDKD